MMADKQWKECALKIESIAQTVIATRASNPRCLPPEELAAFLHCEYKSAPREALGRALSLAGENMLVLVCGSLYLAADIRHIIENEEKKNETTD